MTKRQKSYGVYLLSDHWKELRGRAIERDGGKCAVCGLSGRLQVHHRVYRQRLEDSLLEDLETLCRKCHRLEHGIGPNDFESKCREMDIVMRFQKRPSVSDWKELKSLMVDCERDIESFSDLMRQYTKQLAWERYAEIRDWHMNKERHDCWWHFGRSLQLKIQERIGKL